MNFVKQLTVDYLFFPQIVQILMWVFLLCRLSEKTVNQSVIGSNAVMGMYGVGKAYGPQLLL